MPDDSLRTSIAPFIRAVEILQLRTFMALAKVNTKFDDSVTVDAVTAVEHPEWAVAWAERIQSGSRQDSAGMAALVRAILEALPIPPTEQPYPETPEVGDRP